MVLITPLFLPLPPVLQKSQLSPSSKGLSGVVSVGLWLVRRILLIYIAHEVPLPLFGLGYDWACIFRGAPLPLLGQA